MENKKSPKTLREKLKMIIRPIAKGLILTLSGLLVYGSLNTGGRIESIEQFNRVVTEEKRKLGLGETIIHPEFDKNFRTAYFTSHEDGWKIVLGDMNTRNAIRHELYHIYRCKSGKWNVSKDKLYPITLEELIRNREELSKEQLSRGIKYILREEIPASIYGSYGLKLN